MKNLEHNQANIGTCMKNMEINQVGLGTSQKKKIGNSDRIVGSIFERKFSKILSK